MTEARQGLRPIKVKSDAPPLTWSTQPSYGTQLIHAAIERKGKKRS